MDVDKEYFSNITKRERAIFEGAISMGALFHQFVGTPVNKDTKESLERAMEESLNLQPAIEKVEVEMSAAAGTPHPSTSLRTGYHLPGRNHRLLPALATNVPPARLLNASRP